MNAKARNTFTGGKLTLVGAGKGRAPDAPFPLHESGRDQEAYLILFGTESQANVLMSQEMVGLVSEASNAWMTADLSIGAVAGGATVRLTPDGSASIRREEGAPAAKISPSGLVTVSGGGAPDIAVTGEGAMATAGGNKVALFGDGGVKATSKGGNVFGMTPSGELTFRSGNRSVLVTSDGGVIVTEGGEIVARVEPSPRAS